MSYTTYFTGVLSLSKMLTPEQVAYLEAFCQTR